MPKGTKLNYIIDVVRRNTCTGTVPMSLIHHPTILFAVEPRQPLSLRAKAKSCARPKGLRGVEMRMCVQRVPQTPDTISKARRWTVHS